MPLKALDSSNNAVYSLAYRNTLELKEKHPEGFTCPYCEQKMYARKPNQRILHFYHASKCTSKIEYHPESMEHLLGKKALYYELNKQIQNSKNSNLKVEIEYPVREAGEHGRIADLMITHNEQPHIAIECQLANITVELLNKRTQDYERQGIGVIWFIGKKADTYENHQFLYEHFGDCHIIQFEERIIENNETIFEAIFKDN
jgi:competence CoiA-like predicted nuclease